jgi:hypothetical protein
VGDPDELQWGGPTTSFADCARQLGDAGLAERCRKAYDSSA